LEPYQEESPLVCGKLLTDQIRVFIDGERFEYDGHIEVTMVQEALIPMYPTPRVTIILRPTRVVLKPYEEFDKERPEVIMGEKDK